MKTFTLISSALCAAFVLTACEKPTVVNVPTPVAVPGPAGAQGPAGSTGEPGKPGSATTVIVTPPASAASN